LVIDVLKGIIRLVKAATIILFIFFFLPIDAKARLLLNVSILHHKGIDKGITLLSELHSKEEVPPRKEFKIKMREGVEISLIVDFPADPTIYGPSSKISVIGKVFSDTGKELSAIGNDSNIEVGEQLSFQVKDNIGQLIEVFLKPEFK